MEYDKQPEGKVEKVTAGYPGEIKGFKAEAPRQMTVRETLDRAIAQHVSEIHRLTELKLKAQPWLLDLPQSTLAAYVYPDALF